MNDVPEYITGQTNLLYVLHGWHPVMEPPLEKQKLGILLKT